MGQQSALADKQAQIAGDQWDFFKQNYQPIESAFSANALTGLPIDQNAEAKNMVGAVDTSSTAAKSGIDFASGQLGDYQSTYAPELKSYFDELSKGVDPEQYAAQAHSDVTSAFAKQDQANKINMASYGLNPGGGNWENMERQTGVQEAEADANAQNQARLYAQNLNLERKGQAANVGQTVLNNAMTGINTGVNNMGAVAARYGLLTDANFNRQMQAINTGNRLVNQAQSGLSSATNAYNNLVPQQMSYANNIATGAGNIAGLAYNAFNAPATGLPAADAASGWTNNPVYTDPSLTADVSMGGGFVS